MVDLNTLEFIDKIKEEFNKVIKYSQGYCSDINTDSYFDNWKKNKYNNFSPFFDNKLILELGRVEFSLNPIQRNMAFNSLIDDLYYVMEKHDCANDEIVNFLDANGYENFYENNVGVDFYVRTAHNHDKLQNLKGMKLLRAFKFFVKNKDCLYEMQSLASRVLQKDKVDGILCFSIHPLDFLSLSENAHNWRSCHALDGEYRGGNLSYMQDASTMICYIKSDNDYILPNFPPSVKWNSKKWRMLLFFSQQYDLMMAGRQYPYEEKTLLPKIKDFLTKTFKTEFSSWTNHYVYEVPIKMTLAQGDEPQEISMKLRDKMMAVPGPRLMSFRSVVSDAPGSLQFNDLLQSSTYTSPYYSFMKDLNWFSGYKDYPTTTSSVPKIKVGHSCTCAICNKNEVKHSESFICSRCMLDEGLTSDNETFSDCFLCGERYITDEGISVHLSNGDIVDVCPYCADNRCVRCSYCDEWVLDDDVNEEGICSSCVEGIEEKKTSSVNTIRPAFEFEFSIDNVQFDSDLFEQLCCINTSSEIEEDVREEQNG